MRRAASATNARSSSSWSASRSRLSPPRAGEPPARSTSSQAPPSRRAQPAGASPTEPASYSRSARTSRRSRAGAASASSASLRVRTARVGLVSDGAEPQCVGRRVAHRVGLAEHDALRERDLGRGQAQPGQADDERRHRLGAGVEQRLELLVRASEALGGQREVRRAVEEPVEQDAQRGVGAVAAIARQRRATGGALLAQVGVHAVERLERPRGRRVGRQLGQAAEALADETRRSAGGSSTGGVLRERRAPVAPAASSSNGTSAPAATSAARALAASSANARSAVERSVTHGGAFRRRPPPPRAARARPLGLGGRRRRPARPPRRRRSPGTEPRRAVAPHALDDGSSARPFSVRAYSTRGGTSGNVWRSTMPSSSRPRRRRESVRGLMPVSERSSSQNRERPSDSSRTERGSTCRRRCPPCGRPGSSHRPGIRP
jgi:hypothetical protein